MKKMVFFILISLLVDYSFSESLLSGNPLNYDPLGIYGINSIKSNNSNNSNNSLYYPSNTDLNSSNTSWNKTNALCGIACASTGAAFGGILGNGPGMLEGAALGGLVGGYICPVISDKVHGRFINNLRATLTCNK